MAMVEDIGQWLLRIGEVARITGFPAKTLRYYEELGLVEPGRSSSPFTEAV